MIKYLSEGSRSKLSLASCWITSRPLEEHPGAGKSSQWAVELAAGVPHTLQAAQQAGVPHRRLNSLPGRVAGSGIQVLVASCFLQLVGFVSQDIGCTEGTLC